jgi:mycothiol system anti-sigma-R factor
VDLSEIDCEEVLGEIELYIDGELDPERSHELASHLIGCGTCLEHAEFQRKLKDIVRSKCRTATPEHLITRIRSVIWAEPPAPPD